MSKKIVITGASSEIGLAICRKMISSYDQVILQYNSNKDRLSEFESAENITIIQVDFSDSEQLIGFTEQCRGTDVLINAAAATHTDLLPSLSIEKINRMIQINIVGLITLCQQVVSSMAAKRYGRIINISSVAASKGNPGQTVYGGTKGFMESFTRSLAAEFGRKGVRINCVAPGAIHAGSLKELLVDAQEEVLKSNSAGKLGTPEDVASVVAFLCGDDTDFINGQTLSVDGGFNRGI